VIEMVGRVIVKASQHNKKPIVVHIDRVLDFDAPGSEKERTENIHCIGIDLEAEQEWARLCLARRAKNTSPKRAAQLFEKNQDLRRIQELNTTFGGR
jgi:hypothetical protein